MVDVCTILRYRDAQAAMAFLREAFGFSELFVVPDEEGGVGHAQMRMGDGIVMLRTLRDGPLDEGAGVSLMSIYVEDPAAHMQRAVAAGAEIVDELTTAIHGTLYTARDPEGHVWAFGDYRPSLAGPG